MLKSAMDIKFIGNQTFVLKGKKESVLVNPEKELLEKNTSRIVIYSQSKQEELRSVGEKVAVMGPGEYEIGGVEINGFSDGHEGTIYTVLVDGVTVCILSKLQEALSDKKIEKVDGVDVLITDVANGMQLAKKWGANYVVPSGYTVDSPDYKKFLDEADCEGLAPVELLKVDKDNLPEGMEVVILKS